MRRYACSFDWDRVLLTCDPEYYRWNQWIFLQMFKRGLAYRKDSSVNWCPDCQTVLANEQVVGRPVRAFRHAGHQEEADPVVPEDHRLRRPTAWTTWTQLEEGWPEKVLLMQRNWIGRSTGANVQFEIEGRDEPVTVYTTRPDTLYGATFFVVAADSDLAEELAAGLRGRG